MSKPINDGGPAFPVQSIYSEDHGTNSRGMTLRDYFAGQAILREFPDHWSINDMVENAYLIADAMLDERAKP